jgi:hypothetical protein
LAVLHLVSSSQVFQLKCCTYISKGLNPLNAELNPICHLLALLGAHHILHVSRIRLKGRKSHPSWSNRLSCSTRREITHLFSWNLLQPLAALLLGPCCYSFAISERP